MGNIIYKKVQEAIEQAIFSQFENMVILMW